MIRPDGRVENAEGDARRAGAREALAAAARRMENARGRIRRDDPAEALELWQGLVTGRWSLVDRFDSDGRRYLVAHRNPPGVLDVRRLSRREQQVARLLARGYSFKLAAYHLGLSASTIASNVASLRRKLGAASTPELGQILCAVEQAGGWRDRTALGLDERAKNRGAAPRPGWESPHVTPPRWGARDPPALRVQKPAEPRP